MKGRIAVTCLGLLALTSSLVSQEKPADAFSKYVDEKGTIRRPSDYRTHWSHLGSFMVHSPEGGGEFHDTYAQPEAAEHFRKNGEFPDGAVLVKEVRKAASAKMTTGDASWAEDIKIWFVMIKDRQGRYKENPLWDKGWGWALFKSDAPDKQVATSFRDDCMGCHIPARGDDWVYVGGYPTLKK